MRRFFALVMLATFSLTSLAQPADDEAPRPGEEFKYFFARITRGGTFQGLRLDAPQSVQAAFLTKIQRGTWVGQLNQERQRLERAGVNLWFDWYSSNFPLEVLSRIWPEGSVAFLRAYDERLMSEAGCAGAAQALQQDWARLATCSRRALMNLLLLDWKSGDGLSVMGRLAKMYALDPAEFAANAEIFLLPADEFKTKLHELGYDGEIYFRGITAPNPKDPKRHWIVLNDDLMRSMTPFDRPLLKALEYAGIASHEMSHVAQDMVGSRSGLDVDVNSAEDAMLIEGMAETLNQKAWREQTLMAQGLSPFALFAAEQAVEMVYREGNGQSGLLFPYTVGMPFVVALYDLEASTGGSTVQFNQALLRILANESGLESFLFSHFH